MRQAEIPRRHRLQCASRLYSRLMRAAAGESHPARDDTSTTTKPNAISDGGDAMMTGRHHSPPLHAPPAHFEGYAHTMARSLLGRKAVKRANDLQHDSQESADAPFPPAAPSHRRQSAE